MRTTVLSFDETPEFQKDVKFLKKKWRSLPKDIETAKLVIEKLYVPVVGSSIDELKEFRDSFFATRRAAILTTTDEYEVVKMRLDCASLGNDKKTRLIFIAIRTADEIRLVELYAKNANEREDVRRIRKYTP